jgi:hypothetical protein
MLPAEFAVLIHLEPVRIILLVFLRVVIALFALCAGQYDFYSHDGTSRCTEKYWNLWDSGLPRKGRKKNTPF